MTLEAGCKDNTPVAWEDSFFERKSANDFDDICRTLVAFANTLAEGQTGRLIIGEFDDGRVQGIDGVDKFQQKLKRKIDLIYPQILYRITHLSREEKDLIEITVESSSQTPHFERPAWIRAGNSTVKASPVLYQELIEKRLSKVFVLRNWLGKQISVYGDEASVPRGNPSGVTHSMVWADHQSCKLVEVNQFWLTVENTSGTRRSQPLDRVILNFDDINHRILLLMQFVGR